MWCNSVNTNILADRSRFQNTLFTIASVVSLVISPSETSTFTIDSVADSRYVLSSFVAENVKQYVRNYRPIQYTAILKM